MIEANSAGSRDVFELWKNRLILGLPGPLGVETEPEDRDAEDGAPRA